jgi:predicted AlkP superfamily phosphohydrolase/phosphomutase
VKCTPEDTSSSAMLSEALRIAHEWVGENGLIGILSDTQAAHVKRFVNVNNFLAEIDVIERVEGNGQIQWSNSLAYFAGHGQLWINLLGRDAQGIVNPQDEYEQVRETLIKLLPAKFFDAETGEPIIEKVYRKEEIYAADYLFCAPDLVVVFKPGYAPSQRSKLIDFDEAAITTPEPGMTATDGMHPSQLGGFLLVCAPVVAYGVVLTERVSLTRVYPTLLHALGVEFADLEITAIDALFHPAYLETHPIRSAMDNQELSDEDEELIINRLRDLGYV